MAYISKIFKFPFKHFQSNIGGLPAKFQKYEKSCHTASGLISQIKGFNPQLQQKKKIPSSRSTSSPKYDFKKHFPKKHIRPSRFSKLNLRMIVQNAHNLRDGAVLSLFHKIMSVYYANKEDHTFTREINEFSMSPEFNQFCKVLLAHLKTLPPNALIHFLLLQHFKVNVQNPVMQLILTLIHDNINCFSLCEILDIYVTLKKPYFERSEICHNILQTCEKYFNTAFEDELSHWQDAYELVYYLHEPALPVSVKKLIAERFFDLLEVKCFRTPFYVTLFNALLNEPLVSIFRPKVLEHLKNTIGILGTTLTVKALAPVYEVAVHRDPNNYDDEVCNVLATKTLSPRVHFFSGLHVIENLCYMGYLNYDLVNYVANNVLVEPLLPETALKIASVFARTSFHEKNHNEWDKIRTKLQEFNAQVEFTDINDLIRYCECLTYLGCDTTALFNHIFDVITSRENDLMTTVDDGSIYRHIIRLHSFAKAYKGKNLIQLNKRTLNSCVEKSKMKSKFLQRWCLKEVLGEDFFLRNCMNSSLHFIPAVMVLGSDNKPIDLSQYKIQDINYFKSSSHLRKFQVYINIDNIKKPPGSKMIVFDHFPDRQPCVFRNESVLSGLYRIYLKSIENVQSNVLVLQDSFFYLKVAERCQFLKSKIDEIIKSPEAEGNNQRFF